MLLYKLIPPKCGFWSCSSWRESYKHWKKNSNKILCAPIKNVFQFFIGGFIVKSWTTNFATIYLVVKNVLIFKWKVQPQFGSLLLKTLSNNIKWALQFGQCLVPHILLYNFKTLQDYNSQNENPLANVGPHSFTLSHICGGVSWIPYTPFQLLPLSCFNLVHEPKANVATMIKGMKISNLTLYML
jgi:hypothetical protein